MAAVPDTGAARTTRLLGAAFVLIGLLAFAWAKYGMGPEPLCSWATLLFCGLGAILLAAHIVLRRRQA